MHFLKYFVSHLRRNFALPRLDPYLDALRALNRPGDVSVTSGEVGPIALEHIRGVLTRQAVCACPDWVWPHWMEERRTRANRAFTPLAPPMPWTNTTRRNWLTLAAPNGRGEALVDPRGLVTPRRGGLSVDVWLKAAGQIVAPSRLSDARVDQQFDPAAMRVTTGFGEGGLQLTSEVEVIEWEEMELALVSVGVANVTDDDVLEDHVVVALRPANPEGVAPIRDLTYNSRGFFLSGNDLTAFFPQRPDCSSASNFARGDAAQQLNGPGAETQTHCPAGLANAASLFAIHLRPGERRSFSVVLPLQECNPRFFPFDRFLHERTEASREAASTDWRRAAGHACRCEPPDATLAAATKGALATVLSAGQRVRQAGATGPEDRKAFAAWTDLCEGLDAAGLHDNAGHLIEFIELHLSRSGFWGMQAGEWDSTGRALQSVWEHCRLSGDRASIGRLATGIKTAAAWTRRKIREAGPTGNRPLGTLPAGLAPEPGLPVDHHFSHAFWCLRGLDIAVLVAREVGDNEGARLSEDAAAALRRDLATTLNRELEFGGNPYPGYAPSRGGLSGANLAAMIPAPLLAPERAPWMRALADALCRRWLGNGDEPAVSPIEGITLARCLLRLGDARAFAVLRSVAAMAPHPGCWPDQYNPATSGGCGREGHDPRAAALWLAAMREVFVDDRGSNLVIFPVIDIVLAAPGSRWSAESLPTAFGPVSLELLFREDGASLTIDASWREEPDSVRFPVPRGNWRVVSGGTIVQGEAILDRGATVAEFAHLPDQSEESVRDQRANGSPRL